jgi:adenylate cyclase
VTYPRTGERQRPETRGGNRRFWPTYLGITGFLLFILIALAGGIIWYGSRKSGELAIADAKRLMQEAEDKITERIRLLYDPLYAIVRIASMVPELTTPAAAEDESAMRLILQALRIYPQILSLYVGFDDGEFFMVTHIAGEKAGALRNALGAPRGAAFATEIITPDAIGQREARWVFLAEDGAAVARHDSTPTSFDPRQRPWYKAAKGTDVVKHSDLYIFASSGEPGFTLSRSFEGSHPGVMGTDLAAFDLGNFLGQQRITPSSSAFIFTKAGEVLALPGSTLITKPVGTDDTTKAPPPRVADLNDPVIRGLVAAFGNQQMAGTRVYDVAGRTYIGRVTDIPPRYGQDQLLAIAVPVDEIEQPIADIRNDTLLYSVAFLVFALPLYLTLVVAWIDRKLEQRQP